MSYQARNVGKCALFILLGQAQDKHICSSSGGGGISSSSISSSSSCSNVSGGGGGNIGSSGGGGSSCNVSGGGNLGSSGSGGGSSNSSSSTCSSSGSSSSSSGISSSSSSILAYLIWIQYNILRCTYVEIVFTMVIMCRKNIDPGRSIKVFCSYAGKICSVRKVLPETDLQCSCTLAGTG